MRDMYSTEEGEGGEISVLVREKEVEKERD